MHLLIRLCTNRWQGLNFWRNLMKQNFFPRNFFEFSHRFVFMWGLALTCNIGTDSSGVYQLCTLCFLCRHRRVPFSLSSWKSPCILRSCRRHSVSHWHGPHRWSRNVLSHSEVGSLWSRDWQDVPRALSQKPAVVAVAAVAAGAPSSEESLERPPPQTLRCRSWNSWGLRHRVWCPWETEGSQNYSPFFGLLIFLVFLLLLCTFTLALCNEWNRLSFKINKTCMYVGQLKLSVFEHWYTTGSVFLTMFAVVISWLFLSHRFSDKGETKTSANCFLWF